MQADNKKTKMSQLVDWHLDRLEIEDKASAKHNLLNVFMPTVLEMESSGDYQAANKISTAKGGFQFIEGSVEPALNRLERRIGKQDWGEELRKHKDASKLTEQQQQLLFMGDLLEKKGSDKYMKQVMAGDKQGSMDAYYKLHHTAPDEATINRAESIFGETYDPVEQKSVVPEGAALTGHRTGNNIHTNYGTGVVKEGSPEHQILQEKQNKEINQVISDKVGMELGTSGFKGFAKVLQFMFGFEPDSNDKRNKGGY